MHDYARLEKKELISDVERTRNTLDNLISNIKLLTYDWSQWDDTYSFMENKNQKFIKTNLAFTTFVNAKVNLILFFDTKGKLFYGLNYNLETNKFEPVPKSLLNYFDQNDDLILQNDPHVHNIGLLKIGSGYVVLSSLPILTSEGKGPSHGAIMMGYFFTEQHIKQLSKILDIEVQLYPLPISNTEPQMLDVYNHLKTEKYYTTIQNNKFIYGFTYILDIHNKPIGILKIKMPRTIYSEGINTIENYLAIIITVGIILLLSIWYLLKKLVLDRVISVSNQVIKITSESKFSKQIKTSGKDEITNMVTCLNSLMKIIELTQEQLKHRLILRTDELERLSKLNQNLYGEMTRQKIVETKMRKDEAALRHLAYYDFLTNLPNRVFFNELLTKALNKSNKDGSGLAILFIDIDQFKLINDTYGHSVGDKFLQHVAMQLKDSIKETDLVARLSGDEFIVCLTNIKGKQLIAKISEKILQKISQPITINDLLIQSSCSIGISIHPDDGDTIETLEKRADIAMYYSKKHRGNIYYFYDQIATLETTR